MSHLQNLSNKVTSAAAHMSTDLLAVLEEQEGGYLQDVVLLQQLLRLSTLITIQPVQINARGTLLQKCKHQSNRVPQQLLRLNTLITIQPHNKSSAT